MRPSQGLCSSQIWENIPIYPSGQQPFSAVKLGYESILASKKIHTFNQCFSPKFIHLNCICIFTGTENLLEGSSFRLCFGPHAALMAKVLSVRVLSPIGLIWELVFSQCQNDLHKGLLFLFLLCTKYHQCKWPDGASNAKFMNRNSLFYLVFWYVLIQYDNWSIAMNSIRFQNLKVLFI